jgi:SAM-dependent methyltransferase
MLRQRLFFRIQRHYATRTSTLRLGGREFLFTRVADPDVVLDQVARDEALRRKFVAAQASSPKPADPASAAVALAQEIPLPYWADLWDSAKGLGQFLLRDVAKQQAERVIQNVETKSPPPPAQVLDLGCGMGLAGTLAAAVGFAVTFADRETPALLLARYNALGVAPPCRIQTRQCDWQTTNLGRRFDLILGADILYEASQWPYLERFWSQHLCPGGRILLAEPGRQSGDAFLPWLAQHPWRLQLHSESLPDRSTPIRVLELRSL